MFNLLSRQKHNSVPLLKSQLYNQDTFYAAFVRDVQRARQQVIIESPFITRWRFNALYPALVHAAKRGVQIVVNTRNPECHEPIMQQQAIETIETLQNLGVIVLYTGKHHRKLAVIDNKTLWEGSLNILSHANSCEVMRRIESPELARQMIDFTGLAEWYNIPI